MTVLIFVFQYGLSENNMNKTRSFVFTLSTFLGIF